MEIFERLKIMQAGRTKNFDWWSGLPIAIAPSALDDLCALGNERPIHSRFTHEGGDMLTNYIGRFRNFTREGDEVFADLELSDAAKITGHYDFIKHMISSEPEMCGCSVVIRDKGEAGAEEYSINGIESLAAVDIVGRPAATDSLFAQDSQVIKQNNHEQKNKTTMGLFSQFMKKVARAFAEVNVTLTDGTVIKINKAGDDIAIGDAVTDEAGNALADGDYNYTEDGNDFVITVKDGKIESVGEKEVEPVSAEPATEELFAQQLAELKMQHDAQVVEFQKQIAELKEQVQQAAKFSQTPNIPAGSTEKPGAKRVYTDEEKREIWAKARR